MFVQIYSFWQVYCRWCSEHNKKLIKSAVGGQRLSLVSNLHRISYTYRISTCTLYHCTQTHVLQYHCNKYHWTVYKMLFCLTVWFIYNLDNIDVWKINTLLYCNSNSNPLKGIQSKIEVAWLGMDFFIQIKT